MIEAPSASADQLYDDLNYLLSCMRVRENNFILLLGRLRDAEKTSLSKPLEVSRFLEEEQGHVERIQGIVGRYPGSSYSDTKFVELIGRFWVKLLKLIKVSLERLDLLGLLNKRIWDAYTEVIELLNSTLDSSDLRIFRYLEGVFRRRYMSLLEIQPLYRPRDVNSASDKNLQDKKPFRVKQHKDKKPEEIVQTNKLKSLNRQFNKKRSEQSISKRFIENDCRRLLKLREKLDQQQYKDIDGKVDLSLFDKKKNREVNAIAIYDQLFSKNIPTHKTITKFLFEATKANALRRTNIGLQSKHSATVTLKPKTLLNSRKEQLNKSARKVAEKINAKRKKKASEDVQVEMLQMMFSSSRFKRIEHKIIKVRPKTAKFEKQDVKDLRINFEIGKKRYRKLFKKEKSNKV